MDKKSWRQKIRQQKIDMPVEQWQQSSRAIRAHLLTEPYWQQSASIALYHSAGKEVNTVPILQDGWQQGKKIFLPVADLDQKKMKFYHVQSTAQLKQGAYGFPEPDPKHCPPLHPDELDLIIVPGLLFDWLGYRIGYGGGYYDRFLSQLPNEVYKLSLAFDFQVVLDQMLPRKSFDVPIDLLVTETRKTDCKLHRKNEFMKTREGKSYDSE